MKIIIAGGSGLIGRSLSQALIQRGDEVWILSRQPAATRQLNAAVSQPGIRAVQWDAKTAQGWLDLAGQADAVINLAGAGIGARPWTNERKRLIRSSRVESGQAILEAIQRSEHKPQVMLQIAAVGYYGTVGDGPLDEHSPAGNDFLAGVATDWENAIRPVTEQGVRLVVMRTGVVLSPQGGVLAPFILQNRLFVGGPLGNGRQWISWIHIRDLVRAFEFLLDHPEAQGAFNVTSPEPLTNADFERAVSRVMRRPYWFPTPAFLLKAVLGEMSMMVLEGQRVLPGRLLEMGFQFEFPTLQAALVDLL